MHVETSTPREKKTTNEMPMVIPIIACVPMEAKFAVENNKTSCYMFHGRMMKCNSLNERLEACILYYM